jgi:TRAP-type mannitol/chloroaromatic compound transport system permease large subunit
MLALLAGGTPVAYALGAASVLTFAPSGNTQYLAIVPQRIFSQIDVFALMAMPLFILAGEIMNRAGITKALVDFAMSMLGRFKAGTDPVMLRLKALEGHRAILWLRSAAVVLFLAPILYFCVVGPGQDLARGFLARSASRSTEVIGLSMAWFTVSLPVAFIAILIHVAAELLARRKS